MNNYHDSNDTANIKRRFAIGTAEMNSSGEGGGGWRGVEGGGEGRILGKVDNTNGKILYYNSSKP